MCPTAMLDDNNLRMKKHLLFLLLSLLCGITCNAANGDTFTKVTSLDDLTDGDQIILVNDESAKTVGTKVEESINIYPATITISGSEATIGNDAMVFTIERDVNTFYLHSDKGYLANISTDSKTNHVSFIAEKDDRAKATISITTDFATVCFEHNIQKYFVYFKRFDRFSCYDAGYEKLSGYDLAIYKKSGNKVFTYATFEKSEYTVCYDEETTFVAPKVKVLDKEGKEVVSGEVVYSSSNAEVATIDAKTGVLTFKNVGSTTISARYLGNETYSSSVATYVLNYQKKRTKLTFGENIDGSTIKVYDDDSLPFTGYKAILSPSDIGSIVYSTSNKLVASVDANSGDVSLGSVFGTAVITAKYSGDDNYAPASVSYTIEYIGCSIVFSTESKSFDNFERTSSSTIKNVVLVGSDNNQYTFKSYLAYKSKIDNALLIIKEGGYVNSPKIEAPNGYKVIVTYFQTATKNITLKILNSDLGLTALGEKIGAGTTTNGLGYQAVLELPESAYFQISTKGTVYISKIEIVKSRVGDVGLSESQDNGDAITDAMNKVVNVKLGRTYKGEGFWNTLCVPFDVSEQQLKEVFGDEVEVCTYDYTDVDKNTMYFKPVIEIEAGKPYLVKPAFEVVNPVFENVKITSNAPVDNIGEKGFYMKGVYKPTELKTDGTNLFIGNASTFKRPYQDGNIIKAMRVYFVVPASYINKNMAYGVGNKETSLDAIEYINMYDDAVFSIDGCAISTNTNNLPSGLYIKNGKKVLIK